MVKAVNKKYKFAVIASDVVILTIKEGKLQVLLMKMEKKPYEDCWAAPGGLVKPNESVNQSAGRILLEKTGLKNIYLEQLYTFGEVDRDPFGRVVSVAYFALLPSSSEKQKALAKNENIEWFNVNDLPALAYDHSEIIKTAIERLRAKLAYTNIISQLLPEKFSLSELQSAYEIILKRRLDKRNFRKKIKMLALIKKAGGQKRGEPHRPAELFRFWTKKPRVVDIL